MFLSKKEQLLERDILDLLDNQIVPVSMKEIVTILGYPTLHAVQKSCHLLQEKIFLLYSPEELELVISVRDGIYLKRNNVNLDKLSEELNQQLISYPLILKLLEKREIETSKFCEEHFTSHSTLFRYIQKSNADIQHYSYLDLKITISNSIRILGEESTLRIAYFFILDSNYDTLEQFEDWENAVKLTRKLFSYINLPYIQTQLNHIAIWTYVCQKAINQNFQIKESDPILSDLPNYQFMSRPNFLNQWEENDWQLFLLFFYAMEYMPTGDAIILDNQEVFNEEINCWLTVFEKTYFELSAYEEEKTANILVRQLQYLRMIQFKETIIDLLEIPRNTLTQTSFPVYYQQYQEFWKLFLEHASHTNIYSGFRIFSFQNCTSLTKINFFSPEILIYVITKDAKQQQIFNREMIRVNCSKYNVTFTEDYHKADIIVSSVAFVDPIAKDQELIIIRGSLPQCDLNNIYEMVKKIHRRKSQILLKQ